MLGLYGLIRKELYTQDKLPLKYCDVPDSPVLDKCFLYVDAINNTGNGHSNSATTWKNLMGGTNGTKVGSPKWEDDALVLSSAFQGFYFMKSTPASLTLEAVFDSTDASQAGKIINNIESGGCAIYASPVQVGACVYNGSAYINNSPLDIKPKKHYAAYTIDSSKSKAVLYSDSFLTKSELSSRFVHPSSSKLPPWTIGYNAYYQSPWYYNGTDKEQFIGKIHSIRVHSRALSEDEIRKNMLYERNRYNF